MILYNCFLNQLRKEKRKICPCPVFYSYIIAIAYLSFSLTLTALPWPLYRQLQTSLWHLGHKISRCLPQQLWKLPWRVSLTRAGETEKQAMLLLGPVCFWGLSPESQRKTITIVELLLCIRTRQNVLLTRSLASQQPGQKSVIIPTLQMRKVKWLAYSQQLRQDFKHLSDCSARVK